MNQAKIGALLKKLRMEKGYTQKQVADLLHLTDKTISKWERGAGVPDIAILRSLSQVYGVEVETLLQGDLRENAATGGNMKRVKFYVCPQCKNTLTATGGDEISCCGRKLLPLEVQQPTGEHHAAVERVEDDYYITFSHPMSKDHYITFVAYADIDRVLFMKLYPEQAAAVRFPRRSSGKILYHCSEHGLFEVKP